MVIAARYSPLILRARAYTWLGSGRHFARVPVCAFVQVGLGHFLRRAGSLNRPAENGTGNVRSSFSRSALRSPAAGNRPRYCDQFFEDGGTGGGEKVPERENRPFEEVSKDRLVGKAA
jgi:hypothetical protein